MGIFSWFDFIESPTSVLVTWGTHLSAPRYFINSRILLTCGAIFGRQPVCLKFKSSNLETVHACKQRFMKQCCKFCITFREATQKVGVHAEVTNKRPTPGVHAILCMQECKGSLDDKLLSRKSDNDKLNKPTYFLLTMPPLTMFSKLVFRYPFCFGKIFLLNGPQGIEGVRAYLWRATRREVC